MCRLFSGTLSKKCEVVASSEERHWGLGKRDRKGGLLFTAHFSTYFKHFVPCVCTIYLKIDCKKEAKGKQAEMWTARASQAETAKRQEDKERLGKWQKD